MASKITYVRKHRIKVYMVYHIFKDLFISILYVVFAYMYRCVPCAACYLWMPAQGIRALGNVATDGCDLPQTSWEENLGSL